MFRGVAPAEFGDDAEQRKRARIEIAQIRGQARQFRRSRIGRRDLRFIAYQRQRWLRLLDPGSQLVIAAQAARDLLFVKQQRADCVERGVIQLLSGQRAAAPIATLFGLVEMKAQMGFDLGLQRAAALAATSRGEHRVVNGRSGDAKMARQLHRVEAGVMNGLDLPARPDRPPRRLRVEIRNRVNDDDAYLTVFAESQLDKRNAFIFTIHQYIVSMSSAITGAQSRRSS